MATIQSSTPSVDAVCHAAAINVVHDLKKCIRRVDNVCRATAAQLTRGLKKRIQRVNRTCAVAAQATLTELKTKRFPAVRTIFKWLREPIAPHCVEFNAAWHGASKG